MNNFDDAVKKINNLKDAGTKYYDYPKGEFKDIPFYQPDTEELSKRAEKIKKDTLKGIYFCTAFFLAFLIIGIISNRSIGGIIIMSVLTAIMIALCIYMTRKKAEIAVGTAIFKYKKEYVGKRQKNYYVSVIVDGVIYSQIPIHKKDYVNVEKGTQILIEKVSGWSYIL